MRTLPLSDAGRPPLSDAGRPPLTDAPTPPLTDAPTPPLGDAGPLPLSDAEARRDGGAETEAEACSWEYDETPVDGGISPIHTPPDFGSTPDVPPDSGADGQVCLALCSTPRCFPFAHEFSNDGSANACVADCVESYRHARAEAPEACVEAMVHRDDVYLSASCDCNSERLVAELSAELDRACVLSPSSAEGTELGLTCRAHCSGTESDGGDTRQRCFEQCVADFSRLWLLAGSRCLQLELELLNCKAQGGDSETCEGEAAFYRCLQATR